MNCLYYSYIYCISAYFFALAQRTPTNAVVFGMYFYEWSSLKLMVSNGYIEEFSLGSNSNPKCVYIHILWNALSKDSVVSILNFQFCQENILNLNGTRIRCKRFHSPDAVLISRKDIIKKSINIEDNFLG